MHAELAVVRTRCILAERADGEKRARHLQQAEKAFASILEIAKRVVPNQQDSDEIEEARRNIRRLGGRDFTQPHTTNKTGRPS